MRIPHLLFMVVAVILSLVSGVRAVNAATGATGRDLLLFYSNDVKGETEPCG